MNITENFTLEELLVTQNRKFLEENRNPSEHAKKCLTEFAKVILQPIRDLNGSSVSVNSAYRCRGLNKAVGGADGSQHLCGEINGQTEAAADICDHKNGNLHLFELIRNSGLPFDQLITECPDKNGVPAWVHVSWNPARNRRQVLKAKVKGYRKDGAPLFEYETL